MGTHSTDPGGTGDYVSVNAWVSAQAGDKAGVAVVLNCFSSDGSDDTTAATVAGFSNYNNSMTLQLDSSETHAAAWNDANWVMSVDASNGLRIQQADCTIKQLQFNCPWTNAFDNASTLRLENYANILVDQCKFKQSAGTYGVGVREEAGSGNTHYYRNNVFYDFRSRAVNLAGAGTVYFYANTIVDGSGTGGGVGLESSAAGTFVLKNNVGFGNTDDWLETNTFDASGTNNGYSEGVDPVSSGVALSGSAGTDLFEDYTNNDFTPKSTGALYQAGADLDADANLAVTVDHIGTTRHATTPSIGAFEATASGVIQAMSHLMQLHNA